ncbi:MAG: aspartate carbamoyltransferase catalytic subunit [Planctomycetaceae bacterium]|nr:aspartate carbamoyltransferase catalytic subunit [Planctomycetaceae bacterium]
MSNGKRATETEKVSTWNREHLLSLESLTQGEILTILDTARRFREVSTRSVKKVPALRGRVVVNLFFETSTRTRSSFSLAAQRLSADILDITAEASSTTKGETLVDTAKTLEAMGVDIFIVRHKNSGAPQMLAEALDTCVVNAGDGTHEHPTQGLLDIYTLRERFGDLKGKRIALVGDIVHSRVARSNIWGLTKLGAKVAVIGPTTLVPSSLKALGVEVYHNLDEVIADFDVFNILRIQLERQGEPQFPSLREYALLYGINEERLARMRKDVVIMHPGPMNRGVEITPAVADGPHSVILEQVSNGLAVRMAVLFLLNNARLRRQREGGKSTRHKVPV